MLFQLETVTKTYGAVTALNNLSVTVPTGAIGLLGPNGSGKTTLIRTLLGLIRIDAGSGQILNKEPSSSSTARLLSCFLMSITLSRCELSE